MRVIASLLLALGTIGSECLQLDNKRILALQLGFVMLFYVSALHLQGSLANLSSLPCILAGLALLPLALSPDSHRRISILAGVLFGGVVLFYSEVVPLEVLAPAVVVLIERAISNRTAYLKVLMRFVILLLVSVLVSNHGARAVIPYLTSNVGSVQRSSMKWSNSPIDPELFLNPFANQIGVASPFDESALEAFISRNLTSRPERLIVYAVMLAVTVLVGFYRLGRRGLGIATPFVLIVALIGPLLLGHDQFKLFRAIGFSVPYLLIGLVVGTRIPCGIKALPVATLVVLVLFASLNFLACFRTTTHILNKNLRTDKTLHRLNPNAPDWVALRAELRKYPISPVLLSGYPDTRTPHWIVSGIEPCPNVLGESITSHWNIRRSPEEVIEVTKLFCSYPERKGQRIEDLAKWDWTRDYERMIHESKQALVPPGGPYPPEWKDWYDVLPGYRSRYTNICDVVYKDRKAILEDNVIGALHRDDKGVYRMLTSVWTPRLFDDGFAIYTLVVTYDGDTSALTINGFDRSVSAPKCSRISNSESKTEIPLRSFDFGKVEVVPSGQPVKLRSIELKEARLER